MTFPKCILGLTNTGLILSEFDFSYNHVKGSENEVVLRRVDSRKGLIILG